MNSNSVSSILPSPFRIIFSENILKKLILFMVIFLILPLLAFYIFQVGDLVRQSYLLQSSNARVEEAKEDGLARTDSNGIPYLEKLEEEIKALGFIETKQVKFIAIPPNYLVRKDR